MLSSQGSCMVLGHGPPSHGGGQQGHSGLFNTKKTLLWTISGPGGVSFPSPGGRVRVTAAGPGLGCSEEACIRTCMHALVCGLAAETEGPLRSQRRAHSADGSIYLGGTESHLGGVLL